MKQRHTYPAVIYDALPYVYVGVGILTIAVLRNPMAVFSGLTLISAGVIVWMLRHRYRRAAKRSPARVNRDDGTGRPQRDPNAQRLMQMSWRSDFECGHPVIDGQHKLLFGISNELINSLLTSQSRGDTEVLMEELIHHTREHFMTEEAILARTKYPLCDEHREHHSVLLNKAVSLLEQFHKGQVGAGELIAFLTLDVVSNHILKEDLKFAAQAVQQP